MPKSLDLFDTLVAGSNPQVPCGEQLEVNMFPIMENIARVGPDDLVVSDYHTPDKAQRVLSQICGLNNKLICTLDGKASGTIWKQVLTTHHLGDNKHSDVDSPRRYGIQSELTTLSQLTIEERQLGSLGWAMREARLRTWSPVPTIRGLQLHQIDRNFPFLLKVAHVLNAATQQYDRLLLCSRDCYLLHQLMSRLFPERDIRYFYSSRVMSYRPTPEYAEYVKSQIDSKTVVVDMVGSGDSLKTLTDKFGGKPMLVVSIHQNVPSLVFGGIRETSNPGPHESVRAYPEIGMRVSPEIQTMLDAFQICAEIAGRDKLQEPGSALNTLLANIEDRRTSCLWDAHMKDSQITYDLLTSGPVPVQQATL